MDDAADWSELPIDLLGLIIDQFKKKNTFSLLEYIRFGAVCFEWRSFYIQYCYQIKLPANLPVVLLPSEFDEDYNHDHYDHNHDEKEEEQKQQYDNHEEEEQGEEDYYYNHNDEFEPNFYEPGPREYYYKRKGIWKGQDETRHMSTRSFFSLSDKKINQHFLLPVPYYKNCRGSSYGWLITVDEEEQPDGTYICPVQLLNPFRSVNNQIQLPVLTPILGEGPPANSFYLLKAHLSANPSSLSNPAKDLLVFIVYCNNSLGFCRPGDSAWTHMPREGKEFRAIEDLICYKGRFLVIIQEGSVLELEFDHHLHPKLPSVKVFARSPRNGEICNKKYLVESEGDLVQVQRHNMTDDHSTTGFRAFKLNDVAVADNDDDEWVEMDYLDGRMLFLGDNRSISLSAADFPGLKPNCIYFTDDNCEAYEVDPWDGPHDIGIFNFKDKSVVFDHYSFMPQPIFIQPML